MNEGLIPRRYAKALLAFACEKRAEAKVYDLMQQLTLSFEAQPALQQAVTNPFVSAADKTALIATAAGLDRPKGSDEVFDDFMRLLIARGRIEQIRAIALAYIELYRAKYNIFNVKVTSAAPIDDAGLNRIKNLVGRHLGQGAKIEFAHAVDPSLIGGFAISVGNERLDASIAGEMKQLRQRLLSNS